MVKQVAFRLTGKDLHRNIQNIIKSRKKSQFAFIKYYECFVTTNLPITKRISIEHCVKRFTGLQDKCACTQYYVVTYWLD
jgi:hypothetical protein